MPPAIEQQESISVPHDTPVPAAEPKVIEGEVTLELPPPEPEATSPDAGQQAPHGEITVHVAPDKQEAPAPQPRRLSSLLVVATGTVCLAVLLAHFFLPAFLAPPATVTITPLSRDLSAVTTLSCQGRRAISARALSTRPAALPRSRRKTWPPSPAGKMHEMTRWSLGPISTPQRLP